MIFQFSKSIITKKRSKISPNFFSISESEEFGNWKLDFFFTTILKIKYAIYTREKLESIACSHQKWRHKILFPSSTLVESINENYLFSNSRITRDALERQLPFWLSNFSIEKFKIRGTLQSYILHKFLNSSFISNCRD